MAETFIEGLVLSNSLQKVAPFQFQLFRALAFRDVLRQQQRSGTAGPIDPLQGKLHVEGAAVLAVVLRIKWGSRVCHLHPAAAVPGCGQRRQWQSQEFILLESVGVDGGSVNSQESKRIYIKNKRRLWITFKQELITMFTHGQFPGLRGKPAVHQ